jgi:hypothetical protein
MGETIRQYTGAKKNAGRHGSAFTSSLKTAALTVLFTPFHTAPGRSPAPNACELMTLTLINNTDLPIELYSLDVQKRYQK